MEFTFKLEYKALLRSILYELLKLYIKKKIDLPVLYLHSIQLYLENQLSKVNNYE